MVSRIRRKRGPFRGVGSRPREPSLAVALSDTLRTWATENLADGVAARDLVVTLIESGVPRHVAVREIAELHASPLLGPLSAARNGRTRAEQVLALVRSLEQPTIDRRAKPSAEDFYAHYFHQNRPCVLEGFTSGWRALQWTPETLAERLGDAEIEVVRGRDAFPDDFDQRTRELSVRMPFRDYVRLVRQRSPTNDLYSVAHNKNMDRAAFAGLLADVDVDEGYFDPTRLAGGTSFWLGPAGTITPLHHDTTNILFCQLYGRKKMVLVSPFETNLLHHARGFYSSLSGEAPEGAFPGRRHTVVLEPGDALFLPVGWWHEVRALDVSISFSLLPFRRPNSFESYGPGFVE